VAAQVESCRKVFEQHGLNCQSPQDYPTHEGPCQTWFDVLYQAPFVLRADLPPNRVVAFLLAQEELAGAAGMLVDFGCGRITASLAELTHAAWRRWCDAAASQGGTTVLERAPEAFRRGHAVFGRPRADWTIMHHIKAALDPHGILAPGRLPGKR
jgi:FAD/FMN-containing dehydrogenase